MRKCAKCGALNSDTIEICGSCGSPLGDSAKVGTGIDGGIAKIWSDYSRTDMGTPSEPSEEHTPSDSLLSIALNIRRIFILFLYLIFTIVLTQLYGLWLESFNPSVDTQRLAAIGLGLILGAAGIALLLTAIYEKKLSRPS